MRSTLNQPLQPPHRPARPRRGTATPNRASAQRVQAMTKVDAAPVAPPAFAVQKDEGAQAVRAAPVAGGLVAGTVAERLPIEAAGTGDGVDAASARFYYRIAVAQVIANLVGSILTSLLLGGALFFGLRRHVPHIYASATSQAPAGETALACV